ncbi:AAA family ATPase [Ornithinimicrobium cerasi]|uniref:AAA family ATPase n=1 Tax=Ornithinimicrobium cerasi TaxID=2248773 RepID=UPI00137B0FF7|nr:AAA family ATPase [Ornithinimicrobium cerasi]
MSSLQLEGFFGYAERSIDFKSSEPTIFTGPNGSGKTQTLRIIEALLKLDISALSRAPITSARLSFTDGSTVEAVIERGADLQFVQMRLAATGPGGLERIEDRVDAASLHRHEQAALERVRNLDRVGPNAYIDRQTGVRLTLSEAHEIYGAQTAWSRRSRFGSLGAARRLEEALDPALVDRWPAMPCITIDTKRLDSVADRGNDLAGNRRFARDGEKLAASRIAGYLRRIGEQVESARRQAIRVNQSADSSFAARALDRAHETVKESDLRERYQLLVSQSEELAENGLHFGDAPPPIREGRMNPTERRILAVFLEDWEKRLRPLQPINRKIDLFRSLIDGKLAQSYKGTAPTEAGIAVVNSYGQKLKVSTLSSGEQHLVAIFTQLLFDTRPGSVVLVDEPEISLHPAWQHEFINDLERVGELVAIQTVIATHSPSIVNGNWNLEVPLSLERPPEMNIEGLTDEDDLADSVNIENHDDDV